MPPFPLRTGVACGSVLGCGLGIVALGLKVWELGVRVLLRVFVSEFWIRTILELVTRGLVTRMALIL